MKKLSNDISEDGFVHLMPVLIVALLLIAGTVTITSLNQTKNQTNTASKGSITKVAIENSNSNVLGESESGSGSSGSGSSGSGSDDSGSRIDQDARDKSGRTRVQVDEGQTRLEQEIFEGGVRKRIEMRNENGRIRIRVKVKDLATGMETEQRFEQRPDEGRVSLRVTENGVEKEVKIRVQNDRFIIEQAGFGAEASASATTKFPLTVDTETNSITVTTPLGVVNVQQLPATAIQNILAANILDKVESTELAEPENEQDKADPNKQVVFRIKGVKETRFLGLIKVDAPILAEVSAITGQTTLIQQPWFLNAFGFLFAK